MIGALRNEIAVLAPSATDDAAGGRALDWAPSATLWARVTRLSSVRGVDGARAVRLARIAATVRQGANVALGGRVRFAGVDYEIVSIEDADDRRRVTLVCEEARP
ncbi:MAG: head-tail adaptor protein [Parvularculaceae bacterium]